MKVEGFFRSIKAANEAVEKLKNTGVNKAFVDLNDHYNEERNIETNLPGTETSTSLSGLVLESDAHGIARGKSPLNAASPMVSGMGGFEEIADINCKVIVEAGEQEVNKVKQIIKEMGGELDSPNLKKPKLQNDEEIILYNALDEIREDLF
ncbi:MAG: hypothetical protein N3B21_08110 [Clostridia bacterium]|nr:hypothetical protein [Clostridia bacterium]